MDKKIKLKKYRVTNLLAAFLCLILICALIFFRSWWLHLINIDERIKGALIGGLIAALATALGTLPILFSRRMSDKVMDSLLGFGAGVMLAATSFSLIIPGLDAAKLSGAGAWHAGFIVGAAILLGGLFLLLIDRFVPHEHFIKDIECCDEQSALALKRTWMFVFAILLHNLPEGLAIGVAFGGTNLIAASSLTTGIAIQDIPEGLVVTLVLLQAGYRRSTSILIGMLSGIIEPIGAVLGASIVTLSSQLLPWGLGFAAGAMLFVISHEIIPESHRKGHESFATCGLMIGFVLMMLLDSALS